MSTEYNLAPAPFGTSGNFVPQGQPKIAQRFNAGPAIVPCRVPEGRQKSSDGARIVSIRSGLDMRRCCELRQLARRVLKVLEGRQKSCVGRPILSSLRDSFSITPQLSLRDIFPAPKGLRRKAQGCRHAATLGNRREGKQPQRGCGSFGINLRNDGRNPVGVDNFIVRLPRVARSSQPWALRRNPFGILSSVFGGSQRQLYILPKSI